MIIKQREIHIMEKVTIYKSSGMGNIIAIESHLKEFGFAPYAQYPDALQLVHRMKRKRTTYRATFSPALGSPNVLVVKGWGQPAPQSMWGTSSTVGNVTVAKGRYSSCDDRWQGDFNKMIDQHIESGAVEVVVDTRGRDAFKAAVAANKEV